MSAGDGTLRTIATSHCVRQPVRSREGRSSSSASLPRQSHTLGSPRVGQRAKRDRLLTVDIGRHEARCIAAAGVVLAQAQCTRAGGGHGPTRSRWPGPPDTRRVLRLASLDSVPAGTDVGCPRAGSVLGKVVEAASVCRRALAHHVAGLSMGGGRHFRPPTRRGRSAQRTRRRPDGTAALTLLAIRTYRVRGNGPEPGRRRRALTGSGLLQ
jgi:hypothetical protein